VTLYADPYVTAENVNADFSLYAQDQWTVKHLTLNMGLRYDSLTPAYRLRMKPRCSNATVFSRRRSCRRCSYGPVSDVPICATSHLRLGAAYYLFGDGKTAIKVRLKPLLVAGQDADFRRRQQPGA